jgi:hypothetical protein
LTRLTEGWLCFEQGERKCRLSPIPAEWAKASDAQLDEWRQMARPAASAGFSIADALR